MLLRRCPAAMHTGICSGVGWNTDRTSPSAASRAVLDSASAAPRCCLVTDRVWPVRGGDQPLVRRAQRQ